jgi:hypothetical protein
MAQTYLYSMVFVVQNKLIHRIMELKYMGAKKHYRERLGPAKESLRVRRIGGRNIGYIPSLGLG